MLKFIFTTNFGFIIFMSNAQERFELTGRSRVVKIINVERWQSDEFYFIDALDSLTQIKFTIISNRQSSVRCEPDQNWTEIKKNKYYKLDLEVYPLLGLDLSSDSLRIKFHSNHYSVIVGERTFSKENLPYFAAQIIEDRICLIR